MINRRRFLSKSVALAAVLGGATGPARSVLADAVRGRGPYGPLGSPDAHGLRLPEGFRSTVVARTGELVGESSYRWHDQPDGGATFALANGHHIYVSNSEVGAGGGGVGAIQFDEAGRIHDARPVLTGTSRNCSGGTTPWGTWLSCEENGAIGQVWECDPKGPLESARLLPALGTFNHEAVQVVEQYQSLFLTEDRPQGRLYRFRPTVWPDLTAGMLEAAHVDDGGFVTWVPVDSTVPERTSATSAFAGGEGLAMSGDSLFMTTKLDRRLWRYDMAAGRIDILHDAVASPDTAVSSVDDLFVDDRTGNLFIAEDQDEQQQLCVMSFDPQLRATIAPVVELVGHDGSEVTGPSLSPDGCTMYFSSQRGTDGSGITFAIVGPWGGGLLRGLEINGLQPAKRMSAS